MKCGIIGFYFGFGVFFYEIEKILMDGIFVVMVWWMKKFWRILEWK